MHCGAGYLIKSVIIASVTTGIKTIDAISSILIDFRQYLQIAGMELGLLMNFK